MEKITEKSRVGEIESLKPYHKYLCYQASFEQLKKPPVDYTFEELQAVMTTWDAGALASGLQRAAELAEKQEVVFDVYPEAENVKDEQKRDVKLWYFPSEEETDKPFIILNAGGAYQSVCTMVEAFPTAVHFNRMGYPVFCLNYRVGGKGVIPKPLEDVAAACSFIRANQTRFRLRNMEYIVGGFSAGGNLASLWGTEQSGYKKYGMPKPKALLLVYPAVSRERFYACSSKVFLETMFGENTEAEEYMDMYDTVKLVTEAYPPCYLVHCADDDMVPVGNSTLLKEILEKKNILVKLEVGLSGGHAFGDGTNTDAEGWPERAISFLETIS